MSAMSAGREALVAELRHSGENWRCAECDQRGPTYVDVTIGDFVCSRCSGLLDGRRWADTWYDSQREQSQFDIILDRICYRRGLTPPHRVKSISMATFTNEEVNFLKSRGNSYCRSIWMGLYEGEQQPFKDEQSLKDFLSDKYEKKRYYLEPDGNEKLKLSKEPIVTSFNTSRDNKTWSSVLPKPVAKITSLPRHSPQPANCPTFRSSTIALPNSESCFSGFQADFASADIFNSSQVNNNIMLPPPPSQSSFSNIDKRNSNTVTQDRYAALADLDFTLRQQNQEQTQSHEETSSSTLNYNPFDTNFATVSKNPFYPSGSNINGNTTNHLNPFIVNSNYPSGQSKNPFL